MLFESPELASLYGVLTTSDYKGIRSKGIPSDFISSSS
jgi:hypothetical protein